MKRTATKKNTLNPVWDEDPMSFETATKDVDVLIAVFDSDFLERKAGSLFSKKKNAKTVFLSSTILAQLNNFEEIVAQSRRRHDEFHVRLCFNPSIYVENMLILWHSIGHV
jgi:hypothetical protein